MTNKPTFHCPEWTHSQGECCPDGAVRHECPALRVSPIQERAEMHARNYERFDRKVLLAIQTVLIAGTIASFLTGMAHIGLERHSDWLRDNQEILTLRGSL